MTENVIIGGRNDKLFQTLRFWACGIVRAHPDSNVWHGEIFSKAAEINETFDFPLPYPEVKATTKSVVSGTWKKRHELNHHQRVLTFADEAAEERMSKGAEYTDASRRKKLLQTLQRAVAELRPIHGDNIGVSPLVSRTDMNIKAVRKYFRKW
ncbi:hypothetical protein [Paraburkholderia sediminicola]|uniref:hypothetical protein n=1 Tax=Paraburkholderia sediminicola TaxID=458836 RepID=UPI0038B8302A